MAGIAMKSELDLFTRKPTQVGVLKCEEVALKPLAALHQNSQIEFLSLSQADTYRDLNSIYLRLRVRLMKDVQAKTAHTDAKVGVVNNIIHSLFRQVTIYMNNKIVYQSDNYHMRAYIESLLNVGDEMAETHLDSSCWIRDKGDFNALDDKDNKGNPGFVARAKQFGSSVEVELCSKLHCDLFNQPKYLLNGVDMRIIMAMEKPEFYIMGAEDDKSAIEILDATLFMKHLTISPSILAAHEAVLQRGNNAIYPYSRVQCNAHTVGPGSQTMTIDNIVLGRLPVLILVTFIDSAAYVGKRTKNPFFFEPMMINQCHLIINGRRFPSTGLTFDYTNAAAPISARAYDQLFRETKLDRSHQIKKSDFDKSCFIIAFDVSNDGNFGDASYVNVATQGTISLEARFSKALEKTVTVLVYAEFDGTLEINKNRDIMVY